MNKKNIKFLLIFSVFFLFLNIHTIVNAKTMELDELDYDVTLNEDGSANILETWKIKVDDTKTLFKNFDSFIDKIKDVEVYEVKEDGTVISFKNINEYKYHVDEDCYYGLIYNNKFEIAWGLKNEYAFKTYKIKYTIEDAVKNYNDCSEFYWKFISDESNIPADKVIGEITLPNPVYNIEELKVWAHGPLNGTINVVSKDKVQFTVEDLNRQTMLETRIVTPANIFSYNENTDYTDKLQTIINEETQWANEANLQRIKKEKNDQIFEQVFKILKILYIIITFVLLIVIVRKIKKYSIILKQVEKIEPTQKYDYYRDLPNKDLTPAQVGYIFFFKNNMFKYNMPQIISATILDLALKKYIKFEKTEDNKDIKMTLRNSTRKDELQEDEKIIFEMLENVSLVGRKSFTIEELKKYLKRENKKVKKQLESIEKIAKKTLEEKKYFSEQLKRKAKFWNEKFMEHIVISMFSWIFPLIFILEIIICIKIYNIYKKYNTLAQLGEDELEKLNGLKKYMEHFSKMEEKNAIELVLWEKYLVYATIFGIASKVIKQLKVINPSLSEESLQGANYAYMSFVMTNNFDKSLISTLNSTINSSGIYSSGSGAGGGFSSGGGFGGGGGRNGRKIGIGERMKINIVLVEPEIPQNTGNIARTCAATGGKLHLVKPLGFNLSDKYVKRAGLDYWDKLEIEEHDSLNKFLEKYSPEKNNMFFVTTKGKQVYSQDIYKDMDEIFVLFGKETKGLPEELLKKYITKTIRIPMKENLRSLNLSNSVAIVVYEILRQKNFEGLEEISNYF